MGFDLPLLFALHLGRLSAALVLLPVFGERRGPALIGVVIASWLSALLVARSGAHPEIASLPVAFLAEAGVGLLIGFSVRVALLPLDLAGELLAQDSGLSIAATFDPVRGEPSAAVPALMRALGLLLFLGCGGAATTIALLARSFDLLPPGAAGAAALRPGALAALPALAAGALRASLELALPVGLATLLSTLALGALSRAVPRLNVFADALPIRWLALTFAFGLVLPRAASLTASILHDLPQAALAAAPVR